jgi:hypothetical protein
VCVCVGVYLRWLPNFVHWLFQKRQIYTVYHTLRKGPGVKIKKIVKEMSTPATAGSRALHWVLKIGNLKEVLRCSLCDPTLFVMYPLYLIVISRWSSSSSYLASAS